MTDKPTRTTSKRQTRHAIWLGTALMMIGAAAVWKGLDTGALDALIWSGFALVAAGLGIYQGVGLGDHIASRMTGKGKGDADGD